MKMFITTASTGFLLLYASLVCAGAPAVATKAQTEPTRTSAHVASVNASAHATRVQTSTSTATVKTSTHVMPAKASPDTLPKYRIGPGDVLKVFVWRNPELSATVPVLPDGRISTPLDSDMPAVGKTTAQLARDIKHKLAQYIKHPVVNVMVMTPHDALSQVSVIGEVEHPESLPYSVGLTVLQAILDVGGPNKWAALSDAKIVRRVGVTTKTIHVNLYALLQQGRLSQNLPLKAGDVIVVPSSSFF